jgi:GxxExxY protein
MLTQHPANEITAKIITSAIEVHRHMGAGLLESVYERCLVHELQRGGVKVETRVRVPVHYKDLSLECAYWIDLLVEGQVIVELKAVEQLAWIHEAQLLTYLRLTGREVGLVINFNVPVLKHGIRRVMNTK